ncbi:MAG: hypothetical protein QXQ90_05320 [Desulfurococcaceae archaeon]
MKFKVSEQYLAIAGIVITLSAVVFMFWREGKARVDATLTLTIVHVYLATLFVEKRIALPRALARVYQLKHFDVLSLLAYLPAVLLMYVIGYNYGGYLLYTSSIYTLVCSIAIGLISSLILYLVNDYLYVVV